MDRISIWVLPILIVLLFPKASCEDQEVNEALRQFMDKLSAGNGQRDKSFGWNSGSDPCINQWVGVNCTSRQSVRKIVLEGLNLTGILDASSVCMAKSLQVLSVKDNNIAGTLPAEISDCKRLTHLYVTGNQFSGNLPDSLSQLGSLARLDISNNNFSGKLPDLPRISGLKTFYAENNQLSGGIPDFDFSNLDEFNVSNNNFSGAIPDVKGRFKADSFSGNPGLCGKPLPNACPPTPPKGKQKHSTKHVLLFSGYIIVGLLILLFVAWRFIRKKKSKEKKKLDSVKKGVASDTGNTKPSGMSSGFKTRENRSEFSITSSEGGTAPGSPLVVFSSPTQKGLRFADLLRAPAELIRRGKHGSLYKVTLDNGVPLAVKRLKDWNISSEDFRRRMQKIDQAKNPNVLPPVAYYCSKQEKLLVYEYQPNGSLFQLLHGSQNGQSFDWESRLGVAAAMAKALAFMHKELQEDEIAHGNLKSTNILFNKNMDPCICEYGLMVIENEDQSFLAQSSSFKISTTDGTIYSSFKVDVYGFGVILLELLTGKLVQNSGFNLAKWVHSVVREEWTVEVFDRALISEGANEERMVNLLQVALKCINASPSERPSMNEVAAMIDTMKEEEERSISSEL